MRSYGRTPRVQWLWWGFFNWGLGTGSYPTTPMLDYPPHFFKWFRLGPLEVRVWDKRWQEWERTQLRRGEPGE